MNDPFNLFNFNASREPVQNQNGMISRADLQFGQQLSGNFISKNIMNDLVAKSPQRLENDHNLVFQRAQEQLDKMEFKLQQISPSKLKSSPEHIEMNIERYTSASSNQVNEPLSLENTESYHMHSDGGKTGTSPVKKDDLLFMETESMTTELIEKPNGGNVLISETNNSVNDTVDDTSVSEKTNMETSVRKIDIEAGVDDVSITPTEEQISTVNPDGDSASLGANREPLPQVVEKTITLSHQGSSPGTINNNNTNSSSTNDFMLRMSTDHDTKGISEKPTPSTDLVTKPGSSDTTKGFATEIRTGTSVNDKLLTNFKPAPPRGGRRNSMAAGFMSKFRRGSRVVKPADVAPRRQSVGPVSVSDKKHVGHSKRNSIKGSNLDSINSGNNNAVENILKNMSADDINQALYSNLKK